jgi:hypothetical protein
VEDYVEVGCAAKAKRSRFACVGVHEDPRISRITLEALWIVAGDHAAYILTV